MSQKDIDLAKLEVYGKLIQTKFPTDVEMRTLLAPNGHHGAVYELACPHSMFYCVSQNNDLELEFH